MLIKMCIMQFDRLHKTLEKTERDHETFRRSVRVTMEQADFPTTAMIDDLEAELKAFRLTYLPDELSRDSPVATVDHLDSEV